MRDDDDDKKKRQESLPYVSGSDTSKEAAEEAAESASSLREKVYTLIYESGENGMTCEECEHLLSGKHQTISARVNDLKREKRIIDSGQRRKNQSGCRATVYVVTGRRINRAGRTDWRRISLARLILSFGVSGFEIRHEGLWWHLDIPGEETKSFGRFSDLIKALGEYVADVV